MIFIVFQMLFPDINSYYPMNSYYPVWVIQYVGSAHGILIIFDVCLGCSHRMCHKVCISFLFVQHLTILVR